MHETNDLNPLTFLKFEFHDKTLCHNQRRVFSLSGRGSCRRQVLQRSAGILPYFNEKLYHSTKTRKK